jgi:4-amino-4-deoxy-L-arabinose transferase-like glycosyltransferase
MRLSPIFLLVAGTTLLRLGFAATTGLGVDESYMVTAGRVLSLGYFDHPPASWWLSWGAAHLFGTEAPVVVRLPFIMLFALSQLLMWRIGCLIFGRQAGFWAVVAFNLSPVFGVTTGSWVLPDGPLDAALLAAVLCLLRALSAGGAHPVRPRCARGASAWWIAAGLCAGMALFSKYSAVLTMVGVLLFLLTDRTYRHWLARPEPYFAALAALVVFSPVLIWNAMHGWASFAFQGDRAAGIRFRPLAPVTTLAGEAMFVLPWVWLPMMILLVRGFGQRRPSTHRLLVWLAALPILVFALISAWSSQRVLYHWGAPGYLMLFPLLGEAIAARQTVAGVRWLIAGSGVLVLAAVTVISAQIQFDWLGGRLTEIMHDDPTQEGADWTSMYEDLRARGVLPPGTVAAAMNWRNAGKIGFALGPEVTMLCLCTDSRQFAFAHPVHEFAGQDVILLLPDPPEAAMQEARRWFHTVQALPGTSIRVHGRVLRTVTVLRGEDLRPQASGPGGLRREP